MDWLWNPDGALTFIWDGTRDMMEWTLDWGSVSPGTAGRAAASELAGFWIGLTAFFVTTGVGAFGIARGVITNKHDEAWRAALGIAFGVPAALVTIWFIAEVLKLLELIPGMLTGLNGDVPAVEGIIQYFGLNEDSDLLLDMTAGNMFAAGLNGVLAFFGFFTLGAVRIVRGLGVMAMVAFAPFVFTMLPIREGSDVHRNYTILLTGLLLTDPILLGMMHMLTRMAAIIEDPWSTDGLIISFGLAILGIAPMAVLGMFTWAGVDRDAGGHATMRGLERGGRSAGRGIRQAAPAVGRGAAAAAGAAGRGAKAVATKTKSGIGRLRSSGSGSGGRSGGRGTPGTPGSGGKSGGDGGSGKRPSPGHSKPAPSPGGGSPGPRGGSPGNGPSSPGGGKRGRGGGGQRPSPPTPPASRRKP
ncbi:hypothetical protein [Pseudoclavibacter sp. AY1H1]|uniref:hypothetical protein n=1 Tax=Pseudoclavibacter sp. AY1H1 TaxID=2080584 RepID=UPI000CE8BEB7|nr:hypothetical protein [Pseudoclavibacter sp. AY1H1]PPF38547.1 hypothetical protein C5E05_05975 [Pseudoclavibacter sp. AY1H1]